MSQRRNITEDKNYCEVLIEETSKISRYALYIYTKYIQVVSFDDYEITRKTENF